MDVCNRYNTSRLQKNRVMRRKICLAEVREHNRQIIRMRQYRASVPPPFGLFCCFPLMSAGTGGVGDEYSSRKLEIYSRDPAPPSSARVSIVPTTFLITIRSLRSKAWYHGIYQRGNEILTVSNAMFSRTSF
jgi:hypothetical protein